jgi:hypothetical protein
MLLIINNIVVIVIGMIQITPSGVQGPGTALLCLLGLCASRFPQRQRTGDWLEGKCMINVQREEPAVLVHVCTT